MPQKGSYITKEGLVRLEVELNELLTVSRQEIADRIQKANEIGGTVDNAEYDESKNAQAFVEGRIRMLDMITSNAIVIDVDIAHSDIVQLGCHVVLLNQAGDEEEYTIVGSTEADPMHGRISNESPVGNALLNKKVADNVQVKTPAGMITLTISSIS